ncbi:circadian clock-controlled protein daywake-like [Musca autumnalis]|uniref:circadian clock-controlled protein daywake-like n=1 Tax=Musca autumnalis TaxID=221902 RepID=UPI003CF477C7
MLFYFTILLSLIVGSCFGDLPSDVEKCKVNDNECVATKIMEILKKFPNGNSDFGMPKISAMQLKNVTVARASDNSPIKLNFRFEQFIATGLENSIVLNTSGWTKTPKNLEANIIIPKLVINGDFETDGRILLLSLEGKGKGFIELTDCYANIKGKVVLEKRSDGKNYLKLTKLKAVMQPKKFFMKMDNLVKGSQELTQTLNDVLNDNWIEVWNELSAGINDALSKILLQLTVDVFNKLSYDDFFVE